ncbi:hypothetical protein D9M72_323380 [compost metagenome]
MYPPNPALAARIADEPMGTCVMLSTPAAITMSMLPDITAGPEMQRLLRGAALAINRGSRHGLGQAGSQHRVAGLLASLADAAQDHVFDQDRIRAAARDQRIEHLGGEVDRMPAREAAAAAASGPAGRGNDEASGMKRSPMKF